MKILMVEDHELFAENVIAEFLAEDEVTVVSSIEEATRVYTDTSFDVVLVDYDLIHRDDAGLPADGDRRTDEVRGPRQAAF